MSGYCKDCGWTICVCEKIAKIALYNQPGQMSYSDTEYVLPESNERKWQEERSAILSVLGETDYSEVDIPQRIYELRNQSREYFHTNTRLNARIEQLDKFAAACHKIYIARNIIFDEKLLLDAFKEIDVLLRDTNEN